MTDLQGARIVVAGAGALGLATALTLAREGARVTLADPAGLGENASGIAAGMLAPAFETVLDSPSPEHYPLLLAARDAWPEFAESLDDASAQLDRSGGLWVDLRGTEEPFRLTRSLRALGATAELVSPSEARERAPGLAEAVQGGVFTPEDWRLEPAVMLRAMAAAAGRAGVSILARAVVGFAGGEAMLSDGRKLGADALVLATGFSPGTTLAPELRHLSPVKGQLLAFTERRPRQGPAVRTSGGYCTPSRGGAVVGATMEPGLSDLAADPIAVARMRSLAASLFPRLGKALATPRAGVRAATPDGLPLVGASGREGVWLACGARRNGWLLAPLAAKMLAAHLAGRPAGFYAGMLDARRFDRA